ncbi:hypothetical protein Taro_017557 [Colocasia esculenta]|uniref:Uncharacterized protein n=1 Tax=Colocasia esculenta TaxID=4460 RepID=A0A843UGG9_COLES|nr:hypothetical protein [Colocasia esculenta]
MICRSNWAVRFLCEPSRDIVPSVVVRPLFQNASLVGYPRFFVSQARVFVVLGVCPGTCVVLSRSVSSVLDTLTPVFELYVRLRERRQWDTAVGPFVRDCETERLFLCCVVRVGYWPDQPVVHSRVVASFFPTRALPQVVVCERRLTIVIGFVVASPVISRQHRLSLTPGWRKTPWTSTYIGVHLYGRLHGVGGDIVGRQPGLLGLRNNSENLAH